MNSREIITRVIERRDAPRIGFSFNPPHQNDIIWLWIGDFQNVYQKYAKWGKYPELMKQVPGFSGEVKMDQLGNIYGRVGIDQNGECIRGVLQEDWSLLEDYEFPDLDQAAVEKLYAQRFGDSDKFVACVPSVGVFSALRDMRLMSNALMDTVLEPEMVSKFLEKVQKVLIKSVELAHGIGGQALFIYDDWGMQHAPFISPDSFCALFKPVYKAVADELHNRNMKLFVHSCGLVWDFIPHFIEAGVDVLQFDQPELSGTENLARTFGKKFTLYSPVDIQKIMATGDRELIETTARSMIRACREYSDGALIAKDYPAWADIGINPEWADWARDVFLKEGWN